MVTTHTIKINMVTYLENIIDRLYVIIMHVKFCVNRILFTIDL